jgi:hypothetical protein
MDISELLEFFKALRMSGFENCYNLGKKLSTRLEIASYLRIVIFDRMEYYFLMKLWANKLLMRETILKLIFFIIEDKY